jgi:hypothetical protein
LKKSSKEHLVNDIENRLDDFFGENAPAASEIKPGISIEKLKSVVLSIDWEITESCLTELINETDALLPRYENDRLPHTLLRMLRAAGRYIRQHKAQSHPGAIKLIMSVFNSMEQIIGDPQMPEDQRKGLVAKEISAFKKLKQQIDTQRGVTSEANSAKQQTATGFVQNQEFMQAISTIEQRMNSQVADLKLQVATLQKELNELRVK